MGHKNLILEMLGGGEVGFGKLLITWGGGG